MTQILFYLDEYPCDDWRDSFLKIDPTIKFFNYPDWDQASNDPCYAMVWEPKLGLLAKHKNIKAIFSIGAGVDHLLCDPDLPQNIPIIRMGDDGLNEGMAEYVLMNVLMHHRKMPHLQEMQQSQTWTRLFAKAASEVRVGILGYGALGKTSAEKLKPLGYKISTWSRSPKKAEDQVTHYTGANALKDFLNNTDILVCLLPETSETIGLLNEERLMQLPKGASIINAGRGKLINIPALQKLINCDHIESATLDVLPEEPLPSESSLWNQRKLIITPHVAAITRPNSAAEYVLRNIKKLEQGLEVENKLDLKRGY